MPVFLVLSTLSVMFYTVVLVALYRDGRRRSLKPQAAGTTRLGVVAKIGGPRAVAGGQLAGQPYGIRSVVLWATGPIYSGKPEAQSGARTSSRLVALSASAPDKDGWLCS